LPAKPKPRRAAADETFINPYTFVPFTDPGSGFRKKPAGHDVLADGRYMGEVTVRLTTVSPLLLRGITSDDMEHFPRRDGRPFLRHWGRRAPEQVSSTCPHHGRGLPQKFRYANGDRPPIRFRGPHDA
jgi:hypothetical protein